MDDFTRHDWKQFFYDDVKELIPSNTPRLIGKEFIIQGFVDADFVGDNLTIRSRSGFLVMQCCEYLKGLQYKFKDIEGSGEQAILH